jgi:membrane protease subunit HflC
MKRNLLTIVIGAVLIVIFALLLFVFQVRQSEVAVVTTFGRPSRNLTDPGRYFKWPWPVQKVYKYDQRVQNFEDKYSESLTTNGVTLLTSVYVGWKISDAGTFIQKFPGDPATVSIPNVQNQLEGILRSAKSGVIGQHPLSDLVNANPQDLKFDAIEHEIEDLAQSQLRGKNYGIELVFLGFKKIGLPESVTQTVFQRMTAERQVKINQLVYDGEKQATIIKSAADRQAADTISQATAAATRIQGEAVAEAAKTLPVFQQNPELAIFLLSINTLQKTLDQRSTLIFDERTPPFNLFQHLPTNSPGQQP